MKTRWQGFADRLRRIFRADKAREARAIFAPASAQPGRFSSGVFCNDAGTREYRLFVPGGAHPGPWPLVVMLHGCKQDAGDFAAGTRMNELAAEKGWAVLYPAQSQEANLYRCWNWFEPANQHRDRGEPSLIANMTRRIVAEHGLDARRVFAAGLSAGGAMAAVMAATYPDLFAAVGVHSGLRHRAAHGAGAALRVMKHGPTVLFGQGASTERHLPLIVFHGDLDDVVHPANGDELAGRAAMLASEHISVEEGEVPGGRRYTRMVHRDASSCVDAEYWIVHGCGHAWSGGSEAGSFTDPLGPDASAQMLRFFAEHPRAGSD